MNDELMSLEQMQARYEHEKANHAEKKHDASIKSKQKKRAREKAEHQALFVPLFEKKRAEIKAALEKLECYATLKDRLLHIGLFDMNDVCEWTGLERMEVQQLLSLLIRGFAIERVGRPYKLLPVFTDFLRGDTTGV